MNKEELERILARIYEILIGKSWEKSETFEAYQDSWHVIQHEFKIPEFDWTKGEKPKIGN